MEATICNVGSRHLNKAQKVGLSHADSEECDQLEDLSRLIEQWEKDVDEYENLTKSVVDDDFKIGIMMRIIPRDLEKHLGLNVMKISSYAALRKEIFTYLDIMGLSHVIPWHIQSHEGKDGKEKSERKVYPEGRGPEYTVPEWVRDIQKANEEKVL